MVPNLLFEIAKCKNFYNIIASTSDNNHYCSEIINAQFSGSNNCKNNYLLPEPWSGDIVNAPILVVSSNPSYSFEEIYPDSMWSDGMIADFFINRFRDRGEEYSWVYKNKVLNRNGERSQSVRYWSSIKQRVQELLGRKVIPGDDYCITEIVHCKSKNEQGVKTAIKECEKFFNSVLNISGAKIIIAVGSKVKKYLKETKEINGKKIIYIPHPNARCKKKLSDIYSREEIEEFLKLLKSDSIKISIDYSDIQLPSDNEVKNFIKIKTSNSKGKKA